MEEHSRRNKSFIDSLSPKSAFRMGLLGGLGVMFIIGFFILLGIVLSDGGSKSNISKSGGTTTGTVPTEITGGDPTAPTTITLAAITEDDYIRGDENAEVTIVEYSDLECPYCTTFHATMNQVMGEYDGRVNWVYRHFPLTSIHPGAQKKAEGAECVGELGGNDAFWKYIDLVFDTKPTVDNLSNIASQAGVNAGSFQDCLDSGKYATKVSTQARDAQNAGGRGTPYSVIVAGDTRIPINGAQPFASVQAQLETILSK